MDRTENIFPITALKVGEPAFIVSINARGELARRIRDMGLGSGMPVSVVGYAPLRDPLALRCAEVTIALRRREAKAIMVRHNSEPQAPAAAKASKR
ncbi:MAG: FeoA family protein [Desulfovibrio sp.]|uniref:FeoA family protein n=1 Tax=Desulfovibrio sp. TaxID=885 RepID=UPI002A362CDA|nr:FeoA family protein [Desulfovibrio sp.]MDY0259728.1 FeoA family protein [Desulfovibrio sp.]